MSTCPAGSTIMVAGNPFPDIYSYAARIAHRRVRDFHLPESDADDLLQEGLLRLVESGATRAIPQAHAKTLARTGIADAMRARRRRFDVRNQSLFAEPGTLDEVADSGSDLETHIIAEHDAAAVRTWRLNLSGQLARVFDALYVRDLNQREAARQLGVTQARIYALNETLKQRARSVLR